MSDRRPSSLCSASFLSPQQPVATFFPCSASPAFLVEAKKAAALAALHYRYGPCGMRVDRLRSVASHRGRDGRGPEIERTRQWRPSAPSPRTATASPVPSALALNAKAKLVRVENPSDKGPHFRIFAGNVELGAAWQKTAKDTERDYLSVKLDDPSFPAPIYATLIEVEGQEGLQLIWSRPSRN